MGRSIRYLPILLLAADMAAALTTLTVAIVTDTLAAARDIYALLAAEIIVGALLFAAQILIDRIWPAIVEQPVHNITTAPAVTVTRLVPPVHAGNPELVR